MYAEIASAAAGIKTFADLTSLILKTKVDSAVTEKAIESQSVIISLQSAMIGMQSQYETLLQEKNALKQELIAIDKWETEATKYSLTDIEEGVFVYVLNKDEHSTAPPHWLCARCYNERYKSILQRTGSDTKGIIFYCQKCGNTLRTHITPSPPKPPPVRFRTD